MISVLSSELDPSLEVNLTVELDRQRELDTAHIFPAEGVPGRRLWLVHLPDELYDGRPYLIGLHVRSGARELEADSFSFVGSNRVLHQPAPPPVDTSAAEAGQGNSDSAIPTAAGDAVPPAEVPAAQDRRRLGQFLEEEFGSDTAKRVLGYFNIIEELGAAAGEARGELLASYVERMRLLSQAANDGRAVEATVVIPAFEHVEYTIAAVISLLEHPSANRYEIIVGNNVSRDETAAVFEAVGGVLRCLTHATNEGFIRNCNLTTRHAAGRYVVLLNNGEMAEYCDFSVVLGRFRVKGLQGAPAGDGKKSRLLWLLPVRVQLSIAFVAIAVFGLT